jgi:hypothetical protein
MQFYLYFEAVQKIAFEAQLILLSDVQKGAAGLLLRVKVWRTAKFNR